MKKTMSFMAIAMSAMVCFSCANNEKQPQSTDKPVFEQAKADSSLKAANDAFYAALNENLKGNVAPLEAIWSHTPDVSDQGPFGSRLDGWDSVHAEFLRESKMKLGGKVECKNLIVHAGTDMGYTADVEEGENMSADGKPVVVKFRGTNIFRLVDGQWKMVHHHTDLSAPLEQATGETLK